MDGSHRALKSHCMDEIPKGAVRLPSRLPVFTSRTTGGRSNKQHTYHPPFTKISILKSSRRAIPKTLKPEGGDRMLCADRCLIMVILLPTKHEGSVFVRGSPVILNLLHDAEPRILISFKYSVLPNLKK